MLNIIYSKLKNFYFYSILNDKYKIRNINKIKDSNECIVIGNGPSLNELLEKKINFFENKELIVVNDFSLSDFYIKLMPSNYVIVDPSYWDFNIILESKKEALENIKNKTNWDLNLIFPIDAKNVMQEYFKNNDNIKIYFFPNISISSSKENKIIYFLFKLYLANPLIQNVLVFSIFVGINMNFNKIYLIGSEHSWLKSLIVNSKNVVCSKDDHFYAIDEKIKPFLTYNGFEYKLHNLLTDFSKMFQGYHEIAIFAKFRSCEIVNLTEESYIDAFKKESITNL